MLDSAEIAPALPNSVPVSEARAIATSNDTSIRRAHAKASSDKLAKELLANDVEPPAFGTK